MNINTMDSDILLNHLKNGEINAWLHKELPICEFTDLMIMLVMEIIIYL